MHGEPTIRPISRAEYHQLGDAGAFQNERVELIRGQIWKMSPRTAGHDESVDRLNTLLVVALQARARVRCQSAFIAIDSEPEPDIVVFPLGDYRQEQPSRAFLLIEVALTSLQYDRTTKADLYAEAGVPEYWIVNLVDRQLEIYDSPVSGRYQRTRIVPSGESASPAAFPDLAIAVASILP